MFAAIAVVLVILWLVGVVVFPVTGSFIHLLLVLALIAIIWHFVENRRATS